MINSRLNRAEEQISESEDISEKFTHVQCREKNEKYETFEIKFEKSSKYEFETEVRLRSSNVGLTKITKYT